LNLVVSRLAYIIHELLRRIQKDSGIESKPTDSWLFIEVSSYESLEEINRFFFDMLDEHAILLKYKKSTKFIEIVSKIENFVQENYYDAMLSIDRIADTLKLSTAHIERMKKAQELLVKTNLSIWRIAQSVGYNSNSYFCISFKKKHGITPAEYRKRPSISIPSG
jgi:two-component system response regulator YesN